MNRHENCVVSDLVFPHGITEAGHAVLRAEESSTPWTLLVSGVVSSHAGKHPDRVALIAANGDEVTYGELHERVAAMAHFLKSHGCGAGVRVAVAGERSVHTVIALLALERIGSVYVPVSIEWPELHLVQVLSRAGCTHLLSFAVDLTLCGSLSPSILSSAAARSRVLLMETDGNVGCELSVIDAPDQCQSDRDHRYIIHTSGSTGHPKGAIVEHGAMMNHLYHMAEVLGLGPNDIVAFNAPHTYVISIWQMLAGLLAGATVAVISERDANFPRRHLSALRSREVTVLQLVPTMINLLLGELSKSEDGDPLPRLRWVISTGEELSPNLAGRALETFSSARLMNAYGMSECSDDVAQHIVKQGDTRLQRLPIGVPIANSALYVLVHETDGWRLAREAETGELFVGGRPVSAGYVGLNQNVSDAFFVDLFDLSSSTKRLYCTGDLACIEQGLVYSLGRVDRQVKIRGVRVELGQVESILEQHPAVAQCAVTAEARGDSVELRAHVLAKESFVIADLRNFMRNNLPGPMIPRYWQRMSSMPVTRSGKIDYTALRESTEGSAARSGDI
ncbi:amino acid adenylation domain-containing protein [Streptomyces sp. NPDC092903]|uniref:amino acid adenylation domain-containing protein n=1 Tax=Streptomyces sp. NPDC092903 TaxID=3366017 RepID=UPI00380B3483